MEAGTTRRVVRGVVDAEPKWLAREPIGEVKTRVEEVQEWQGDGRRGSAKVRCTASRISSLQTIRAGCDGPSPESMSDWTCRHGPSARTTGWPVPTSPCAQIRLSRSRMPSWRQPRKQQQSKIYLICSVQGVVASESQVSKQTERRPAFGRTVLCECLPNEGKPPCARPCVSSFRLPPRHCRLP